MKILFSIVQLVKPFTNKFGFRQMQTRYVPYQETYKRWRMFYYKIAERTNYKLEVRNSTLKVCASADARR